ncbi:formate/nitrite transporter family protein [Segetibacter aerophilus]|uniref:Transporter n=1 Tax=Segetibacter aerophilus TaxID=670293 RepID=A0A512BG81_9BACT|nr:formate/nitrite transporter family protein [Segetibacter aerophilus]GEO10980.1 transporter [Segetibacter aerophilus]
MKPLEETLTKPKEVHEILQQLTEEGEKQHKRSNASLSLSAFGAGLEISFSVLLMGAMYTMFNQQLSESGMHLAISICYPLGFLFVIIGKSELFTEHTTVAVLPILAKSASYTSLFRIWGIVLLANLVGLFIFCCILATLAVDMEIIKPEAYDHLASKLISHKWYNIAGSAVLAGWLMGLLGWLKTSATDTISRIFIIILVTFVIGVAGLHHSVVGAVEMLAGTLTSPHIHFTDFLRFMALAVPGNIIGGSIFVAVLKKSHTKEEDFDVQ